MNIVHIDRQRGWTGQTNRTLQVVMGLKASGWQADLIAHEGGALAERATAAGIDVHEMPLYGTAMYASIVPLAKLLRLKRVDVLHCHGARDHLLSVLVKRAGSVRHLVRTRHNYMHLRSGAFSRLVFRPCSAIVTVSDYVKRLSLEDRIDERKLRTIHDAVDVERFQPRQRCKTLATELGIQASEVVIGHVSSLAESKGVDTLLKAMKRLFHRNVDYRLRCVLLGSGHERWKALVDELCISDRVSFAGHRSDVHAVLPHFDIFVMVSRQEALGTAIIEAMSAGVPVIGSNVGGMPESITPDCGLIVPPDDVDALTSAIQALLDDPTRCETMGKAGRLRAVEHFSTTALVEQTKQLYCELRDGSIPRM